MKLIQSLPQRYPQFLFWLVLIGIVSFGMVQAAFSLHYSLSIDEPLSANLVQLSLPQMRLLFQTNIATPLYYLLLKLWVLVFGESEVALRSLSMLFLAGMIIGVGITARYLAGPFSGLIAAFLVSISTNIGLTFAVIARPYALLGFLVTLETLIVIYLLKLGQAQADQPPLKSGWRRDFTLCVLFIVVNTLGLLTHPIYVFCMAACVGASFLVSKRSMILLTISSIFSVGLFLLLWGDIFFSTMSLPATEWMQVPGFMELLDGFLNLWGRQKALIIVACLGLMILLQWRTVLTFLGTRAGRVTAGLLCLSSLLPFAVSQLKPVYIESRTPILFLPVTCILVAALLSQFRFKWLVIGVLTILALGSARSSSWNSDVPDPFPARTSVAYVVKHARCGDHLIATGLSFAEVKYYLRRLNAPACLVFEPFPSEVQLHPGWLDDEHMLSQPDALDNEAAMILKQLGRHPTSKVWVFYPEAAHAPVAQVLKSKLDSQLKLGQTLELKGTYFDSVSVYSTPSKHNPSF